MLPNLITIQTLSNLCFWLKIPDFFHFGLQITYDGMDGNKVTLLVPSGRPKLHVWSAEK